MRNLFSQPKELSTEPPSHGFDGRWWHHESWSFTIGQGYGQTVEDVVKWWNRGLDEIGGSFKGYRDSAYGAALLFKTGNAETFISEIQTLLKILAAESQWRFKTR